MQHSLYGALSHLSNTALVYLLIALGLLIVFSVITLCVQYRTLQELSLTIERAHDKSGSGNNF